MRIGINGLGRIGRGLVKALLRHGGMDIAALNDVAESGLIAHLLRHDSYYGGWDCPVAVEGDGLMLAGRRVPFHHETSPAKIPWSDAGVDWVVEATGQFKSREGLSAHGRPVILTASSRDVDRQVVFGVNHQAISPRDRILSATSCTTHCVVPPASALLKHFACKGLWFNTVHCYNVSQPLVDAPLNNLRRSRAGALNLIPTTTSAALSVEDVLPALSGKVHALAVRVPAPAVSLTEILFMTDAHEMTSEAVLGCLLEAAAGPLKGILEVSDEELVSQDYLGHRASSIVDGPLIEVGDGVARLIAWYDNEAGYVARLVDLLEYLDRTGAGGTGGGP